MLMLIAFVIAGTAALVIVALARLMWRHRASSADTPVIVRTAAALALWAIAIAALAARGSLAATGPWGLPSIALALGFGLLACGLALARSGSLHRLLGSQADLTRLHVWRLLGATFVLMMFLNRLPALFALPAGLGDIAIGATAPWMARRASAGAERGLRLWHSLGLADLVIAVALGVMTSPGPTEVFHSVPTSEAMTAFPLALVPAFLVPLAVTLHVLSLARLHRVRSRAAGERVVHAAARAR